MIQHFDACSECKSSNIQIGAVDLICGDCHQIHNTANDLVQAAPEMYAALLAVHDAMLMLDKSNTRSFRMVKAAILHAEGK